MVLIQPNSRKQDVFFCVFNTIFYSAQLRKEDPSLDPRPPKLKQAVEEDS